MELTPSRSRKRPTIFTEPRSAKYHILSYSIMRETFDFFEGDFTSWDRNKFEKIC